MDAAVSPPAPDPPTTSDAPPFVNPACPWLPPIEQALDHRITRRHGSQRSREFYLDALRYAQSQWMTGKPAQALLQLDKAWMWGPPPRSAGILPNTFPFPCGRMESSHLACIGVRASNLDLVGENITAGKMPAFRDRLEAYPPFLCGSFKATELDNLPAASESRLFPCCEPYRALVWIMAASQAGTCGYLGNPVRHFQHLASRMSGPGAELRSGRAWICMHLAEQVLPGPVFPRDGRQICREGLWIPSWRASLASLARLGWPNEAPLAKTAIFHPRNSPGHLI